MAEWLTVRMERRDQWSRQKAATAGRGFVVRESMDDEPLILAFCCHYCAYAAADLAGSMRLEYPDNVRVLRLPCTGKLEVNYILAAFERGVDGVIVAGCLEGGCHFLEGNLRARRRVERARQFLSEIGLEPDRLGMFNLSSAEGPRFAEIVKTMVERIKRLGRSPLRPDPKRVLENVQEMSRQAEAMI
jgi:coenzyme F420-reducing hydrogenase delta subunit